jgi:molecular chaperone HscB
MKNHFHILGIDESFALDVSLLEQLYFRKQQEFHPDRQAGKGAAEKQKAILASMEINQAYQRLKNPLTRAQHLLELQGIKVNTDGQDTLKPSPELLMEMMTLREELSECREAASWEKLQTHGQQQWNETISQLTQCFAEKNYPQAALHCLRLRYLEKFLEELRVVRPKV